MKIAKSAVVSMVAVALLAFAGSASSAPKPKPVTLQDGILTYQSGSYLAGQVIPLGFDAYGYNYQAHMFKGSYFNSYANGAGFPPWDGNDAAYLAANPTAAGHWAWPYRNDYLEMKWNDAWLSNVDADGDGKLDRHYGYPTYRGSGAWLTNHQKGSYEDAGIEYDWNYFTKIVAAPLDAVAVSGVWYNEAGIEIGPVIWGDFATVQEIYNDQGTGDHGKAYGSPAGPGVGKY